MTMIRYRRDLVKQSRGEKEIENYVICLWSQKQGVLLYLTVHLMGPFYEYHPDMVCDMHCNVESLN